MRAQTILFLSVDGVKEKLDCRPYRGGGEGQSQETTRGCKPRLFKPVEFLDLTSSVVACYCRRLRRIIELPQERCGRRIFPLPGDRLPDRLLNCYRLLVPHLVPDTRRTRYPMLRSVAGP